MSVFIEALSCENNNIKINLESLLILYIYKICDNNDLHLCVIYKKSIKGPLFTFNASEIDFSVSNPEDVPKITDFCLWPVVVLGNDVIGGICSVARKIIKSCKEEKIKFLLGFKDACLLACSETSIWTKFCEVDVPMTVNDVIVNINKYIRNDNLLIPSVLIKFEYHMQQPVKMHNIYKTARERNGDKAITSGIPITDLNLTHVYGEGLYMTLADALLYPCVKILFHVFKIDLLNNTLPLSIEWYRNMLKSELPDLNFEIDSFSVDYDKITNVRHECVPKESLYSSDLNRYKPQNRIFTKQLDIENSLNIINNSDIMIINDFLPYGYEIEFNWCKIPFEANPEGGALPKKRASRKCEQLENIAKAVIKITGKHKSIIVDFCSGSGHLGILLATLLPNCEIILVENKERSLLRAKERIQKLNLTNIYISQCNLDYFKAKFDIGVSLHACGVATDLVIQNCITNGAHFVCCPCCYGSIHNCYHLEYPRSSQFSGLNVSYKDYISIAHAADQTHDKENVKTKQGFFCMDIVDNDRKLMAESYGYIVHLGKLQPISCTPKNNLLVGLNRKP